MTTPVHANRLLSAWDCVESKKETLQGNWVHTSLRDVSSDDTNEEIVELLTAFIDMSNFTLHSDLCNIRLQQLFSTITCEERQSAIFTFSANIVHSH